jgi:hypothetical protein
MTDRDDTPDRAADGAHELDPAEAARLRAALQRLPEAVEPERDLWPSIRARIDQGRLQALPAAPSTRAPLPWYASPRRLAVAAVLLVMVSVAGTRVLLRGPASTVAAVVPADAPGAIPSGAIPTGADVAPTAAGVMPVSNAAFDSYERSCADLATALGERRAKLDPATVAILERSLATIDTALAEARAALDRDPANVEVRAYVESAYRRKIDFLRRANDVASTWTL